MFEIKKKDEKYSKKNLKEKTILPHQYNPFHFTKENTKKEKETPPKIPQKPRHLLEICFPLEVPH